MHKPRYTQPAKFATILTPLLILTACQTSQTKTLETEGTHSACNIFESITYSRNDTALTRKQIIAHNAVYDWLCNNNEVL